MKLNLKKYIGKGLIMVAITMICTVIAIRFHTISCQEKRIQAFLSYREESINGTMENENQQSNKKSIVIAEGLIGIMKIPKIDLEVSIAEGTSKKSMKYSIGHFTETKMPGEVGNACFVGHRCYAYGEYFNRLDELKKNDTIEILTETDTYKYKVTESFVVKPEELSVLDDTKEEIITLITCTPVRIATHRLIVRAKRVM